MTLFHGFSPSVGPTLDPSGVDRYCNHNTLVAMKDTHIIMTVNSSSLRTYGKGGTCPWNCVLIVLSGHQASTIPTAYNMKVLRGPDIIVPWCQLPPEINNRSTVEAHRSTDLKANIYHRVTRGKRKDQTTKI
jgi:hypothetical protein